MIESILTNKITILLLEAVAENPNLSAMTVIAKGMEIMDTFPNLTGQEKKDRLMKVIYKVAAGKDGVLGTDDDILPKECVDMLQTILEKNLLEDTIKIISETANGKFNIHKAMATATAAGQACLPFLSKCFSKSA